MELYWSFGSVFLMMLMSCFFSGSETAITGASRARLHAWEKEGNKNAARVNRLREKKEQVIGALLLANTLVNILSGAVATNVLVKLFGEVGVIYATFGVTVMLLIFSEVMPKTYAIHNADKVSVAIVPILEPMVWLLSPIAGAINWFVGAVFKLFKADITHVVAGSHLELMRGVIDLHHGDEKEVQDQRNMLRSILDLADVTVGDIMIHRRNVLMINASDALPKIIDDVLASPNTRMPLYKDDPDNIIGIIHAKAMLRELRAHGVGYQDMNIEKLAIKPWFIPDTTTLYDQLQEFRARREHFAVVIDEYGTFEGIVTLEDILEEIVGDIDDEHDIKVQGVTKQPNGSYMVDGGVTIRDLKREFDWELPDEEYSTLAGLIIYEAKVIPVVGQTFSFYGYRFEVAKRHRNQITLIRVTPPPKVDKPVQPVSMGH